MVLNFRDRGRPANKKAQNATIFYHFDIDFHNWYAELTGMINGCDVKYVPPQGVRRVTSTTTYYHSSSFSLEKRNRNDNLPFYLIRYGSSRDSSPSYETKNLFFLRLPVFSTAPKRKTSQIILPHVLRGEYCGDSTLERLHLRTLTWVREPGCS